MFRAKKEKKATAPAAKGTLFVDYSEGRSSAPSRSNSLGILNCVTRDFHYVKEDTFTFGSASSCDILVAGQGVDPVHCTVHRKGSGFYIDKVGNKGRLLLDGNDFLGGSLPSEHQEFSLQIGAHHFFLLGTGQDPEGWRSRIGLDEWYFGDVEQDGRGWSGPFPFKELSAKLKDEHANLRKTILVPRGCTVGFRLQQFLGLGFSAKRKLSPNVGELMCPRCWLRFDLSDIMYVASHKDLLGDDELGEEEMKRFWPTQFDHDGRPLDEKGIRCSEIACPHCRGKLPQGFFDIPNHVFSSVGISGAGKSYYLALLHYQLKKFLFQKFALAARDADGNENAELNKMADRLLRAQSPDDAFLIKTQTAGVTYRKFKRFGHEVLLPQPFIINMTPQQRPEASCSIAMYDNAGEHFLPGAWDVEHPESEHVAHSKAIFFLFDPVRHRDFWRLIKDSPDPQVQKAGKSHQEAFNQDVILSELENRIRTIRNLSPTARIATPFAVIVGKYDLWAKVFPETKLDTQFVRDGKLDLAVIDKNSNALREFLVEHCPDIVGAAESISTNLRYFPVSTFGSHAVQLKDKGVDFAPDPSQINPRFIEIPTVWALSEVAPGLVPAVR